MATEKEQFEIDVLAVGDGEKNGDAIALRFGTPGNLKVMVYDGGTKDSGKALVELIRTHYKTERVDYVVNSHPDRDHASGLSVVLEELEVGELWMHQPWNYSSEILQYFHDGRITNDSLAARLQEKMAAAYELEQLAEEKGITVCEPFAGATIGGYFRVLSPARDWYVQTLIPEFQKSPELKKAMAAEAMDGFGTILKGLVAKALDWIDEKWEVETLRENVSTSAENESSVVLFGSIGGKGILLTGDAGVRALDAAAAFAESQSIDLPTRVTFAQVPHHGSRHNVSTSVLDRILGKRGNQADAPRRTAIASVGKECETHPRLAVVNAFVRRGFRVLKTKGTSRRHHFNAPDREGWTASTDYLEFSAKVESWD
ncbi:ComEC/Rec2 family competence protein [Burkholderia pyrrocinia]|uniref:ComEC/Rec2 family competence protein n=1 Tax=Burkholderia pyrrocinia TaxID=60550 RepID=UPI00158A0ABD|nr:MBL fold metallo-hydrolase [Burkholderia pyrrocinia]